MRQTRKGQQLYFGMKLHIAVDSKTGLAHSGVVTAANVHDKHPLPQLLHCQEKQFYRDCAHASQQELIDSKAPKAQDLSNLRVRKGRVTEELERLINRAKSRVRARGEHVFDLVKRLWGYDKVRYRGLAKNATRSSAPSTTTGWQFPGAYTALPYINIESGTRRLVVGNVHPI